MELAGRVIAVLEPRSGVAKSSGNPWMIQEYVIETHEQFPHRMCFSLFGEDKINQANIQMGEEINVSFDINSREYQGRWFTDIRAWKIDRVSADQPAPADAAAAAPAAPTATAAPVAAPLPQFDPSESTDDLPF